MKKYLPSAWLLVLIPLAFLSFGCSTQPTGQTILFHKNRPNEIWRIDTNGRNATRIIESGWYADYSPDNMRIAYSAFYDAGIWVMNADGSNPVQLTDFGTAPDWSPDGTQLAFHMGGQKGSEHRLWIINADGSQPHQISDVPGSFPDWAPSGKKIIFHGEVNRGLWTISPDGTMENFLYPVGGYPAWSPDGEEIVYVHLREWNLWVMSADGLSQRKLTDSHGLMPAWSPDGKQIAYEVDKRDTVTKKVSEEIWVINADGSGEHRISDTGNHPVWSNK